MVLNDPLRKQYKHLERVARIRGIPEENLAQAFEMEREFHKKIAGEKDQAVRERMYYEINENVHPLNKKTNSCADFYTRSKAELVNLFRKELEGKSILDVGCGEGEFLRSIDASLEHKKLVGIDVSPAILPRQLGNIEFVPGNVINFSIDYEFDVVFSDNIIEHIALADLRTHLQSVKNAMAQGGTLIIITPNRLFGPSDVTNIIDCSYTNQIGALGGHLHETTYTELISMLKEHGFSSFKTVIPIWRARQQFPNVRISPRFMHAIENRKYLLKVMYRFDFLSRLFSRLLIVLICVYSK